MTWEKCMKFRFSVSTVKVSWNNQPHSLPCIFPIAVFTLQQQSGVIVAEITHTLGLWTIPCTEKVWKRFPRLPKAQHMMMNIYETYKNPLQTTPGTTGGSLQRCSKSGLTYTTVMGALNLTKVMFYRSSYSPTHPTQLEKRLYVYTHSYRNAHFGCIRHKDGKTVLHFSL